MRPDQQRVHLWHPRASRTRPPRDPHQSGWWELALIIGGSLMAIVALLTMLSSGASTYTSVQTDYPQLPISAVIDAARLGQVSAISVPASGAASVQTAMDATSGPLVAAAGRDVKAGEYFNTLINSGQVSDTVRDLADSGVAVWMEPSNLAQYTSGNPASHIGLPSGSGTSGPVLGSGTTSPLDAHSSATPEWQNDTVHALGRSMLIISILAICAGIIARGRRRSELAALEAREKQVRDRIEDARVPHTRFGDVAGCDEAVAGLSELVDFLRNGEKYRALGARLPKGALLVGPPGTGKTLLARAVAGEAGVEFLAASGSDFTEKYVGVGAKRVRDLFAKARAAGRAIVFIDEIDAIGKSRDSDSGNNENESTLIALLAEMDGFNGSDVIVLAATNRAELLDSALTRPGRLDRRIEVPLPDRRGREQILAVHAAKIRLDANVSLPAAARRTPGFSGAQLAAVLNEAALAAARRGDSAVRSIDVDEAIATSAMGQARHSAIVTAHDREVTAWHEAGHCVCALLLADADEPVAVSIIPRGQAGGVTWMAGSDEQFLTRAKAHARLVVSLGGRAGEQMLLGGEYTHGACSDLEGATSSALAMATRYGMTRLGLASRSGSHLGGTSSQEVSDVVEELLSQALGQASSLLEEHYALVQAIADSLLEHGDLDSEEIAEIARTCGIQPAQRHVDMPAIPHPVR